MFPPDNSVFFWSTSSPSIGARAIVNAEPGIQLCSLFSNPSSTSVTMDVCSSTKDTNGSPRFSFGLKPQATQVRDSTFVGLCFITWQNTAIFVIFLTLLFFIQMPVLILDPFSANLRSCLSALIFYLKSFTMILLPP